MQVREIMTKDVTALAPAATIAEVAQNMRYLNVGSIPLVQNDRLVGVITDRDIVVRVLAEGGDPETTPVGEICSRELTTIEPTASVGEAVRLMREKAIRRLPVVDNEGFVMGIVSIGDVAVERDRRSALGDISSAPPNA